MYKVEFKRKFVKQIYELGVKWWRCEPIFAGCSMAILILMIPTWIGYRVDENLFNGVNAWIKPFKFELSIFFYFAILATFSAYIDNRHRTLKKWRLEERPPISMKLLLLGWSRTGGDLRVAHTMGLHARQGIPFLSC